MKELLGYIRSEASDSVKYPLERHLIFSRGYNYETNYSYHVRPEEIKQPNYPVLWHTIFQDDTSETIYDLGDALFRVTTGSARNQVANYHFLLYTGSLEKLDEYRKFLKDFYPETELAFEDDKVAVDFRFDSPHGPRSISRELEVPAWEDIEDNYSASIHNELKSLFELNPSKTEMGGKLILWSGPPGTGKTYAIRSLMKSWKKWASFSYITDVEVFFTDSQYMLSTILEGERNDSPYNLFEDDHEVPKKTHHFIIIEDAGEMLKPDAKKEVGQGLSRMLNITDGIIGQGLNLSILITSNEDIKELHPAVTRPGRCYQRIEFPELSDLEAEAWLRAHGIMDEAGTRATLAELYSKLEGKKQSVAVSNGSKIGFGA